ncbi:hypothetical protein [Geodermatophilus obscurus]|uniref:hypothetical protein n=1 Tax=Geodermatophilus obscurus TaxID=1861 RepID=UPI0009348645|nr:hypothetical protein [Geodermatophilus obscurus]
MGEVRVVDHAPILAHATLADCPAELDRWLRLDASIPDGIDALGGLLPEEDVEQARAEWTLLRPPAEDPAAFAVAFPGAHVRPVHGDALFHNLLPTAAGPVVSDLEHVHRGLREWNLAGAPPDVRAGYAAGPRAGVSRRWTTSWPRWPSAGATSSCSPSSRWVSSCPHCSTGWRRWCRPGGRSRRWPTC